MPQYTELVAWLTQEMKSFIGLEEHVNPITSKSVPFFYVYQSIATERNHITSQL
jgi:hypothetical protein